MTCRIRFAIVAALSALLAPALSQAQLFTLSRDQMIELTAQNPFGHVVLTSGAIKNFTFGFPTPLRYAKSLKLSVKVNEPGVAQIVANVTHGK